MNHLHEIDLAPSLLAFAIVYYIFAIGWTEMRRTNPVLAPVVATIVHNNRQMIQRNRSYRALVLCFLTVVLLFVADQPLYHLLMPIAPLDKPVINILGAMLLVISLVWIVVAQLDIDKELHESVLAESALKAERLAFLVKRLNLGFFLMFLGISITLCNVADFVLLLVAFMVYKKGNNK